MVSESTGKSTVEDPNQRPEKTILELSIDSPSAIIRGKIIGEHITFYNEWTVSFDFKPNINVSPNPDFTNVIHFSNRK